MLEPAHVRLEGKTPIFIIIPVRHVESNTERQVPRIQRQRGSRGELGRGRGERGRKGRREIKGSGKRCKVVGGNDEVRRRRVSQPPHSLPHSPPPPPPLHLHLKQECKKKKSCHVAQQLRPPSHPAVPRISRQKQSQQRRRTRNVKGGMIIRLGAQLLLPAS